MPELPPDAPVPERRPSVRVLDPATATRRSTVPPPVPTLYFPDRLLVIGYPQSTREPLEDDLGRELGRLGVSYRLTDKTGRRVTGQATKRDLSSADGDPLDDIWVSSVHLLVDEDPSAPPDAWDVLQRLRANNADVADRVSLEHLMHAADGASIDTGHWGGITGHWGGITGHWGGITGHWGGIGEYGLRGLGGRVPVSLTLPDPSLRARTVPRRPVVVVPDTAVAEHPWFPRGTERSTRAGSQAESGIVRLLLTDTALEAEGVTSELQPSAIGTVNPLTGDRQALEGHGTFIAGLIRQGCPEAVILSVPVMDNDGAAEEGDILFALRSLLERHIESQEAGRADGVIDVVSISMGYYAEDESFKQSPIATILQRFAKHGVLVVAGAGNDARSADFVPAALADDPPRTVRANSRPPVASVGATNPDGQTIALFSNRLAKVSAYRSGVSLVSTMPLMDGAGQPSVSLVLAPGEPMPRTTMDPDNYRGGFAVWSGTSFATPVLAAELAAELAAANDIADVSAPAMRRRAIKALRTCLARGRS